MTYVDTARKKKNGKIYERHLLRKAYRENGKIKRETIANISSCSPEEIEAIKLALQRKFTLKNQKGLLFEWLINNDSDLFSDFFSSDYFYIFMW